MFTARMAGRSDQQTDVVIWADPRNGQWNRSGRLISSSLAACADGKDKMQFFCCRIINGTLVFLLC